MNKAEIVAELTTHLRQQLNTMREAAQAAHEASTGEAAKAEGKYDTRGLEASYLADAQAEQSLKLAESLHTFESLSFSDSEAGDPIQPGALVETELDGLISYYLLTPCAGGITIPYEGLELTTLSPESPLYQKLLGCQSGDMIDAPELMVLDIF